MLRDLHYYQQRAQQEREAAKEAKCSRARTVHEDLARRCEDVLRAYNFPG
ncbi:MAG: hypothetical protein M3Q08_08880 [Pseudomonadota bacterium]|nr:hypothetical protein [Pseudomonadota bacterium]